MRIGIIVYSYTGNTLSVANRLSEALKLNHEVEIKRITAENEQEGLAKDIILKEKFAVDQYDVVVFASPVHAFHLCAVMTAYLMQLNSLKEKSVFCFVTGSLSKGWMGSNRSNKKMVKLSKAKLGHVVSTGFVHWNKDESIREQNIIQLVEKFTKEINNL